MFLMMYGIVETAIGLLEAEMVAERWSGKRRIGICNIRMSM
jgi:hypothetical protein